MGVGAGVYSERMGHLGCHGPGTRIDAHLRIARPTNDLDRIVEIYRNGLGFELLGSFEDHAGFDGVMLGHPAAAYHLEFTRQRGHPAGGVPSPEDLLVFYVPDRGEWERVCARMVSAGFERVASHNPYWDESGATFADPDGYRVVLQNAVWG